jgi:hypothetical protein
MIFVLNLSLKKHKIAFACAKQTIICICNKLIVNLLIYTLLDFHIWLDLQGF